MDVCSICGAGVAFRFNAFTGGYSYFCLRDDSHVFPSRLTDTAPIVVPH